MDISERLSSFEPVDISSLDAGLDTSLADAFLKAFTRVAKSQMKTQQAVELSVDEVREALRGQKGLVDEVQSKQRAAERTYEQLLRFVVEVVDLIVSLDKSAEDSSNPELRSISETMMSALHPRMKEVGLSMIPALSSVPDAIYHFVLSTRSVSEPEQKGRVVEVVKPGYTFRGEVVRKADVIVGE